MAAGIIIGVVMALYAASWLYLAKAEQVLMPMQMLKHYQTEKVMPAVADFFIWADIAWLPWILGLMVANSNAQWTKLEVAAFGLVGLVGTYLFHKHMILTGEHPATLGWKGGHTLVGYAHMPYMAAAIAIICLHFLRLDDLFPFVHLRACEETVALFVGLGLVAQIALDFHLPMKYIQEAYRFIWYPSVLTEDPKQVAMIGAGVLLGAVFTFATGGLFAGFATAVAGAVFFTAAYLP